MFIPCFGCVTLGVRRSFAEIMVYNRQVDKELQKHPGRKVFTSWEDDNEKIWTPIFVGDQETEEQVKQKISDLYHIPPKILDLHWKDDFFVTFRKIDDIPQKSGYHICNSCFCAVDIQKAWICRDCQDFQLCCSCKETLDNSKNCNLHNSTHTFVRGPQVSQVSPVSPVSEEEEDVNSNKSSVPSTRTQS